MQTAGLRIQIRRHDRHQYQNRSPFHAQRCHSSLSDVERPTSVGDSRARRVCGIDFVRQRHLKGIVGILLLAPLASSEGCVLAARGDSWGRRVSRCCRSGLPQLLDNVTEAVVDVHIRLWSFAPASWADGKRVAMRMAANAALNTRCAEGVTASEPMRLPVGVLMVVLLQTDSTLGDGGHLASDRAILWVAFQGRCACEWPDLDPDGRASQTEPFLGARKRGQRGEKEQAI